MDKGSRTIENYTDEQLEGGVGEIPNWINLGIALTLTPWGAPKLRLRTPHISVFD